jgi:hypothetical protein
VQKISSPTNNSLCSPEPADCRLRDCLPGFINKQPSLLQKGYSGRSISVGKEATMDTMTYASVAMLPKIIAEEHTHFVRQDLELLPLDLSMIKR